MHNPANNNCPINADPRNESCDCDRSRIIQDRRLLGHSNWYIAKNSRGQVVIRRESDIKASDTVIDGPYQTKEQARCEKPAQ